MCEDNIYRTTYFITRQTFTTGVIPLIVKVFCYKMSRAVNVVYSHVCELNIYYKHLSCVSSITMADLSLIKS
jgi:hypothetical protein